MSNITSLEQLTDQSFTSSSKGLLTLFLIGLFKLVLGVEFVGSEISIPWLPVVHFEHLSRLSSLYWGLVVYAVCRYILANKLLIKDIFLDAQTWGLNKTLWGKQFVYKFLLDKGTPYTVSRKKNENHNTINIETYEDPYSISEVFKLCYGFENEINRVEVSMHPGYSIKRRYITDEKLNKKHWNLHKYDGPDKNPEEEILYYIGYKISYRVHVELRILMLYATLLMMMKDLKTLDFMFPLIAIISLAIANFS